MIVKLVMLCASPLVFMVMISPFVRRGLEIFFVFNMHGYWLERLSLILIIITVLAGIFMLIKMI